MYTGLLRRAGYSAFAQALADFGGIAVDVSR
jgi:hypothetical protein